jgi:hypothetical protein
MNYSVVLAPNAKRIAPLNSARHSALFHIYISSRFSKYIGQELQKSVVGRVYQVISDEYFGHIYLI